MSTKSYLRLVAQTLEKNPSALMSFGRQPTGIIISIKAGSQYRKLPNDPAGIPHGSRIVEQRYSVHRSLDSEYDHINMSLFIESQNKKSEKQPPTVHLTKATRSFSRLSAIFLRLYPDLRLARYQVLEHRKNYLVSKFDPSKQSLATALFVGNIADEKLADECRRRNHIVFTEKDYLFVIMKQVMPIPTDSGGFLLHPMTKTLDKQLMPQKDFLEATAGMDITQCEGWFANFCLQCLVGRFS